LFGGLWGSGIGRVFKNEASYADIIALVRIAAVRELAAAALTIYIVAGTTSVK
jgi:hypothetical protein